MSQFSVSGADDFQRIAARLKEAGDKKLQRKVSAAMRKVAVPIGREVLEKGAADLPHGGGLAAKVAGGKVGIRASLGARTVSVSLMLKGNGYDLRPIDARGALRHPVFGHRKTWVRQKVQAGRFTVAFLNTKNTAAKAVNDAGRGVLDDIARGS